jgi:GTPase SAR1 family protein
MNNHVERKLKCLFIGENGQGKTSIINMFKGGFLMNIDNPTVGLIHNSNVTIDNDNDEGCVSKI